MKKVFVKVNVKGMRVKIAEENIPASMIEVIKRAAKMGMIIVAGSKAVFDELLGHKIQSKLVSNHKGALTWPNSGYMNTLINAITVTTEEELNTVEAVHVIVSSLVDASDRKVSPTSISNNIDALTKGCESGRVTTTTVDQFSDFLDLVERSEEGESLAEVYSAIAAINKEKTLEAIFSYYSNALAEAKIEAKKGQEVLDATGVLA